MKLSEALPTGLRRLLAIPVVCALLGAAVISGFHLVNGYAIFFNDSRSYIRGPGMALKAVTGIDMVSDWKSRTAAIPADAGPGDAAAKPVPRAAPTDPQTSEGVSSTTARGPAYTANRSVFYGVLAFVSYLTPGFLLGTFLQALSVSAPVAILWIRLLKLDPLLYLVMLAVLTYLTPLGAIAAFVMPDVFAAVMIVCVGLVFAYWDEMKRLEKALVGGLIVYGALCHASHIVILALLAAAIVVVPLLDRRLRRNLKALALVAVAMMVGVIGETTFDMALHKATGEKPLVLPHLMAHLIDMGPGYAYIRDTCPGSGFAICNYEGRLPQNWIDFLGGDPKNGVFSIASLADKRRISDEQTKFALAVLEHDPVGVSLGMARDGLAQTVMFSMKDLEVNAAGVDNYRNSFPAEVAAGIERSKVGQSNLLLNTVTVLTSISVSLSVVILVWLAVLWRTNVGFAAVVGKFGAAAEITSIGLLANAFVCGMIASPYDRFQARVVWIIPLMAMVGGALWLRYRGQLPAGAESVSTEARS